MKVLIIHGFESHPSSNWFPWLQKELKRLSIESICPKLPNPAHPDYMEIMNFLLYKTKDFTKNDIIIGHSMGGYFAHKLSEKIPSENLIIVAPAIGNLPFQELRTNWPDSDIDSLEQCISKNINQTELKAKNCYAVYSSNDPYIPVKNHNLLEGFKVQILKNKNHIMQNQLPEILEIIQNIKNTPHA